MRKKLGELAMIRTGYPFRGRIARIEEGGCRVVQMGDVQASCGEVVEVPARVNLPEGPGKHGLHYGDVLFIARGTRNVAATFVGSTDNIVAAPHLFILRTDGAVALPDYLTWILNHPTTQEQIRAMRRGSAVPFVPLATLAKLVIPVPSIELQNHIAGLQRLNLEEQSLLDQIRDKRRLLVENTMAEAVRRETT